jgi:hypothetical protein
VQLLGWRFKVHSLNRLSKTLAAGGQYPPESGDPTKEVSMRFPRITSGLLSLSLLLGAAAMNINAQSANQTVIVTISDDVMVGKKLLPKGEYQITNTSLASPVLMFFSNDRLRFEANALGVRAPVRNTVYARDTALVLEKIGPGYYLREIWVRGKDFGIEIPLPDRAKRLKRELEMASNKEPERLVVPGVLRRLKVGYCPVVTILKISR